LSFADRLDAAAEACGNPCLIGLDPHLDLLPEEFAAARDPVATRSRRADALGAFCCELVDVVAGRVPAVKPQSAFFEVLGADGVEAWERVVAHARSKGLLVVGDVKRSDIASTAAAYATAFLEGLPGSDDGALCDAITVNPYLGEDAIEPFLAACRRTGRGLFVLVRTSNPGSGLFQSHGEPPLVRRVAEAVERWGADLVGECGLSSVGAVVGATHPRELEDLRERMPRAWFLVPGYGAQGGTAAEIAPAFPDPTRRTRGAIVNSSRGIAFAYRRPEHDGRDWREASAVAVSDMVAELRGALGLGSDAGSAGGAR